MCSLNYSPTQMPAVGPVTATEANPARKVYSLTLDQPRESSGNEFY